MELFETNLAPVRAFCAKPKQKQSLQMLLMTAIANATDLPAKDAEAVLTQIEQLLEVEEAHVPKLDQAM